MIRLNDHAFEILRAEVQKCSGADLAGQVQRDIVLKRLEKLRSSSGSPASLEELRDTVSDIFLRSPHLKPPKVHPILAVNGKRFLVYGSKQLTSSNKSQSKTIDQLKQVPVEDPGYVEAQRLLATYQRNLGVVRTRSQAEQISVEALERAKDRIENLLASTSPDSSLMNRNQLMGQLQGIINQLETVQPGTTAYPEAQQLLESAQKKLEQVQPR